ncbi:MAG: Rpn family recombination-promoting nuclease/putative transposase, partial [Planctomycetaceae bacterium]|nr:Rpn family recombination-promoting nuclease/putative transposase [Planctomycetaceae bacterium]
MSSKMLKKISVVKKMTDKKSYRRMIGGVVRKQKKHFRHDAFGKRRLRNVDRAKKFVRYLFRNKPEVLTQLDIDNLTIDQSAYMDNRFRRSYSDIVYRIPLCGGGEFVLTILIELKSQSSFLTMWQMTDYIVVGIWKDEFELVNNAARGVNADAKSRLRLKNFLFPTVVPVIFHFGRRKFSAPTELVKLVHTIDGLGENVLNMKAMLIDMVSLQEDEEPQDLDLWATFKAFQMVFSDDPEKCLREIFDRMLPEIGSPIVLESWWEILDYARYSA